VHHLALRMPLPAIPAPPRLPSRTVTASEATTLRFDRKDLREAAHRAHGAGRLSDEQLVRVEELCDVLGASAFRSTVELADEDLLEVFDAEVAGEWTEVPFPVGGLVDSRRTGGGASAVWLSDDALLEASVESSSVSVPEALPAWSDAWSAPMPSSESFFPHVSAPASWASNGVDSIPGKHCPDVFDVASTPSSLLLRSHDAYAGPSPVKASNANAITLPPPVREPSRSSESPRSFPSSVPLAQVTLLSAQHSVSTRMPFAPLHSGTKLRTPLADASLAVQLSFMGAPPRRPEPAPRKASPLAPLLFAAVLVLGLIGEVMLAKSGRTPHAPTATAKPATAPIAAAQSTSAAQGASTPAIAIVSARGR
jgi:hypothetical protein